MLISTSPEASASNSAAPEFSVPFGCGLSFNVSQAHDTGSHKNTDVWAWDFKMPEGVPITAAADGVVRLARGDSSTGGCGEEFAAYSNYVVLQHKDGYETQYLHFQSIVVKSGQKVKAGELIGYSGKTGWACGSHLHFKVTRATGQGWNNESVPARFAGYGDPQVATLVSAVACESATKNEPVMAEAVKANVPNNAVDQAVTGASGTSNGKVIPARGTAP
jgi:murein DD-endopeptidase MepM/ murein hydrolase activator NlpD